MPLPIPPTPLIGRDAALAEAEARLGQAAARLLTVLGPPGVGKTRLALELARRRAGSSDGEVVFVALESVSDAGLVSASIAHALGLRETAGRPLIDTLHAYLRERRMLLVLDNFEQVTAAAPVIADLLAGCPTLQILVTSRTLLRLRAETQLPLEPLALPVVEATQHVLTVPVAADTSDAIGRAPAVQLFLARARAVQPELALTPATSAPIATICARLDGLPLAIELAAARTKLFSPRELAERLSQRLLLLTDGNVDAPPRQRTLRAAIAWSYDLLSAGERRVLRLLSVFAGGGTFDAISSLAQDVGGGAPSTSTAAAQPEVADLLSALVDHSLIRRAENAAGSRFGMLETIREYAGEQLERAGEADAARLRQTAWYLALRDLAGPGLSGADQLDWLARLDAEHDNLRDVLRWTLDTSRAGLGLEIAAGLWRFWQTRGYLSEGRGWLGRLLASAERATVSLRATALLGAGMLALDQGDLAGALQHGEQSLTLYQEGGDERAAEALLLLGGLAMRRSDYDAAMAQAEESLALARAAGEQYLVARCLNLLSNIAIDQGRFLLARDHCSAALLIAQQQGDLRTSALLLSNLGLITQRLGDAPGSRAYAEQSLALYRRLGYKVEAARNLVLLAMIARELESPDEACAYAEEALALAREAGGQMAMTLALSQLSAIARARGDLAAAHGYTLQHLETARAIGYPIQMLSAVTEAALNARASGQPARAVRLLAAAEAMREAMELAVHPGMREMLEARLTELRDLLDAASFGRAWSEGTAMTAKAAIAHALAGAGSPPPPRIAGPAVIAYPLARCRNRTLACHQR